MLLQVDSSAAERFLSATGRIAVVGASDDPKAFGGTIYRELRGHGLDVVPVHRSATTVAEDPAFPDVASVRGDLDGVLIAVRADAAMDVVRQCVARGVPKVWLFKGIGHGAVSDEAIALCEANGIEVIPGACPLMFLEPVAWFHRFHRGIRRLRGAVCTR